ncbi:MAG: GIY-YIG nuclease family protein [Xanthobacteraceae bacterium]
MTEAILLPPTPRRSSPWYQRPGVVYFFGAGNPPVAIKIGMTTCIPGKRDLQQSIRLRHKQIQSANHEAIQLLGIICFDHDTSEFPTRDAEDLEQELHSKFGERQRFERHTRGAEWFTPTKTLQDYIRENAKPPEDFQIPPMIGRPINR